MHYSRVSTPPSRAYSAATAVLLNELLKGFISLVVAYTRIGSPNSRNLDAFQVPISSQGFCSRLCPRAVLFRIRKLGREVFSQDCWKLSIPALLYGQSFSFLNSTYVCLMYFFQFSKIIYSLLQYQI